MSVTDIAAEHLGEGHLGSGIPDQEIAEFINATSRVTAEGRAAAMRLAAVTRGIVDVTRLLPAYELDTTVQQQHFEPQGSQNLQRVCVLGGKVVGQT